MGDPPKDLDKAKVRNLFLKSKDFAFNLFKKTDIFKNMLKEDSKVVPVLITALAHDWIAKEHSWTEEEFNAALFKHKINEEREILVYLQKQ